MTKFETLYKRFLLRVEQFSFYDKEIDEREIILRSYLDQACFRFEPYCKDINLFDIDEDEQCFNCKLTPQVIYILVENMAVVWLKTQRDSEENTKNMLGEKDYTTFSPANLLTSLRRAYTEANKEIVGIMNDYSLNDLDTKKLMREVLMND